MSEQQMTGQEQAFDAEAAQQAVAAEATAAQAATQVEAAPDPLDFTASTDTSVETSVPARASNVVRGRLDGSTGVDIQSPVVEPGVNPLDNL